MHDGKHPSVLRLGLVGAKWRGAYVSTKFALEGLSDVLRFEMAGTGIDVILIEPGPITSRIRANSIPHFERHIDWEGSARRDEYAALRKRLYHAKGKDAFELPASAVTRQIVRALDARSPKARYYVTVPTWIAGTLRRILPTAAIDRIIARL